MANEEHVALLRQGVDIWNYWRQREKTSTIAIVPDLTEANLREADLNEVNLGIVHLDGANLSKASLIGAWFNGSNLRGANLSEAYLIGAYFIDSNLSGANLSKAILSEASFNGSNLSRTNLTEALLMESDLSGANLSGSNLSHSSLIRTQALATNFRGAILTGACIEDWNINSATNLDDVICDYVYLRRGQQERRPSSGNFESGEFTKLFQKALETVDLIFRNGIDWRAFLTSFQKLQVECGGEELAIQAIENKKDGAFVIRVNVPPDADKAESENYLKREYEYALKVLEEKYRYQSQAKDEQLADYRQQNANLNEIVKSMASRPINNVIEVTVKAESESMSENSKYNLSNAKFGGGFAGDGGTQIDGTLNDYSSNIDYSAKQSLAEAAAEIQQLLTQLQTKGYSLEEAQEQVATDLAQQAQSNPTVNNKLVKWGQYVSDAVANGIIGDVAVEVIKLALRLAGISIP